MIYLPDNDEKIAFIMKTTDRIQRECLQLIFPEFTPELHIAIQSAVHIIKETSNWLGIKGIYFSRCINLKLNPLNDPGFKPLVDALAKKEIEDSIRIKTISKENWCIAKSAYRGDHYSTLHIDHLAIDRSSIGRIAEKMARKAILVVMEKKVA